MDRRICVYEAGETDYSTNGLGCITPSKCTVHWTENGDYSVELEHPIDPVGKYLRVTKYGRTLVVPVPEAPGYRLAQTSAPDASAETYAITGRRVNLRSGAGTRHRVLAVYSRGDIMTLVDKTGANWYEVIAPDGRHGYMAAQYLQISGSASVASRTTQMLRDAPARPQPFDIYAVDPGVDHIKVKARHAIYRLAETLVCGVDEIKGKTARQALQAVFDAAIDQGHGFSWYCDDTDAADIENDLNGRNLIDILIGDGGICDTYGLKLKADWFDLYLVKDGGEDRGVQIRYAKNLDGIEGGWDLSDVVTRVVPVGQTKDGKPLYLDGTRYLQSAREALYPRPVYGWLKTDVKVGSKVDGVKITTDTAHEKMRALAQAELDGGCDLPKCSIGCRMAQLRYSPAYAGYEALERICPGDTLGLLIPDFDPLGIRLTEYDYDALAQRYDDMTLGSPRADLGGAAISSRQLGGGVVTASKIAQGAVGGNALAPDVISARHIQSESIGTDALQVGSVTADSIAAGAVTTPKLDAGAVTADKLDAATVNAHMISALAAKIDSLVARDIKTDALAAALAQISVLIAGTATFDRATVTHLVAEALQLEYGVGNLVHIKNLAADYAALVSATVGSLVVKASDGRYYRLDVGAGGTVTAAPQTLTDGEITAGRTDAGRVILGTTINASALTTGDLLATYALINRLDAARIDVSELWAREAFVGLLRTTQIVGDKTLTIMAADANDAASLAEQAYALAETGASWRVAITGGGALRAAGDTATLSAHAYYGATDYTERIDAANFSWERVSSDVAGDLAWKAAHAGTKSVTVTAGDADANASYYCTLNESGVDLLALADTVYLRASDGKLLRDAAARLLV